MQAFKFFSLHVFLPVTPVYSHPAPFRDLFIALLLFMQTRQRIYLSAFPVLAPLFFAIHCAYSQSHTTFSLFQ